MLYVMLALDFLKWLLDIFKGTFKKNVDLRDDEVERDSAKDRK